MNAALALLAAIGKSPVLGVKDTNRGSVYISAPGKAASSRAIAKEVERLVDAQILRAGF